MKGQTHEWRENLEDGEVRIVRANHTPRGWRFQATLKSAPDWWPLEKPTRKDFETLREILWNKYQRGRVPHKIVEELDKLLAEEEV